MRRAPQFSGRRWIEVTPAKRHWEAGRVKIDLRTGAVRKNNYGRPALKNDKSKVDY
jgi:hypothetical protein